MSNAPSFVDVAVLIDLDEGGALVAVGAPERFHHVLTVHVVRPSDERRLGTEGKGKRVERLLKGSGTGSIE